MLSGPPGVQNEQLIGTELSRKCLCRSPGSSGIMKPWMRCGLSFSACTCGVKTGSRRFLTDLVFTSVSIDQGSTSARSTRGAIGLLGL